MGFLSKQNKANKKVEKEQDIKKAKEFKEELRKLSLKYEMVLIPTPIISAKMTIKKMTPEQKEEFKNFPEINNK